MEGKRGRKGQEREGGVRWNIDAVTMYILTYLSRNIHTHMRPYASMSCITLVGHFSAHTPNTHTHTHVCTCVHVAWACSQA